MIPVSGAWPYTPASLRCATGQKRSSAKSGVNAPQVDDLLAPKQHGEALVAEELPKVKVYLGDAAWAAGRYPEAAAMFEQMCTGDYNEFLTLPAYELID